jgi:hypothetical protein
MKTLLILLGAGIIGLVGGGIPGYLAGQPQGVDSGILSGVCNVADAAVLAKVLTVDQAEQLGKAVPAKISAREISSHLSGVTDAGEGCKRSLQGMMQGAK